MKCEIMIEKKLVCIWLNQNESAAPEVPALLKPIYQKYKAFNYTVVVFRSGSQDLLKLSSELLRYNRRLFAEREEASAGEKDLTRENQSG